MAKHSSKVKIYSLLLCFAKEEVKQCRSGLLKHSLVRWLCLKVPLTVRGAERVPKPEDEDIKDSDDLKAQLGKCDHK